MFKKTYEMHPNPPSTVSWEEYEELLMREYTDLLQTCSDEENAFQDFFEQAPSFIPGAFELFGTSGHYPYLNCLISQPEIGGIFRRIPDFVWLAQDSTTFCPVLIEIERPSKKTFTSKGIQSAEFTQALDQINEWKMILNKPTNVQLLYDYFDIPDYIRKKKLEPQYGLIFGRRLEFEGNEYLTRKRAEITPNDVCLMSFDRLRPLRDCHELMCVKVFNGRYNVISIPSTYKYSPGSSEVLQKLNGFFEKIDMIKYITDKRKNFLKERYQYWYEYGKMESKGIISSSDRE